MDYSRNTTYENVERKEHLLSDELSSHNFLANLMKHALLLAAENLLMARKYRSSSSDFERQIDNEANDVSKDESGKYKQTSSNEFPINLIAFMSMLMLKLAGFQISLFLRLFIFPFRVFNSFLMFLIFPFQILTHLRHHMKKKLMKACNVSYLRLAVRFGKAVFCGACVFFVLVGLLVSGFAISGVMMKHLVQESIHTTETLNFDYTKTSPVAIVPIASSLADRILLSKLNLVVSLTLPESEYNRKLGIFQIRVESLSANGEVILGSSCPTMLRFKSHPIRAVETLFNSVHLITGLKSEVQNLKIVMGRYNEGYEPTTSFKVILEQRAEFQGGSGVPEIYGGSLEIKSELPKLKRILWNWRRTIFVWIGFGFFMGEMMVFFIFFGGAVLLPGGKTKVVVTGK